MTLHYDSLTNKNNKDLAKRIKNFILSHKAHFIITFGAHNIDHVWKNNSIEFSIENQGYKRVIRI